MGPCILAGNCTCSPFPLMPPCGECIPSSHKVWVSRYSTGRSHDRPHGRFYSTCVAEANLMVSRCILLASCLAARGVHFTIEQPTSSLMQYVCKFMLASYGAVAFTRSNFGSSCGVSAQSPNVQLSPSDGGRARLAMGANGRRPVHSRRRWCVALRRLRRFQGGRLGSLQ
jgi:hypothetical protein